MDGPNLTGREKQTTRSRVVDLLRRGEQTVDELSRALGLTDNAVRVHLTALEQSGIVHQRGVRRSGSAGKPAIIYAIAPDAEPLFSRAYAPVLATLADVLADRLGSDQLDAVMREVGRRIGRGQQIEGSIAQRIRTVAELLESLGAVATIQKSNGSTWVRGAGCPLAVAVRQQPATCRAVQELLAETIGVEVIRHCQDGEHPACCFELRTGR